MLLSVKVHHTINVIIVIWGLLFKFHANDPLEIQSSRKELLDTKRKKETNKKSHLMSIGQSG